MREQKRKHGESFWSKRKWKITFKLTLCPVLDKSITASNWTGTSGNLYLLHTTAVFTMKNTFFVVCLTSVKLCSYWVRKFIWESQPQRPSHNQIITKVCWIYNNHHLCKSITFGNSFTYWKTITAVLLLWKWNSALGLPRTLLTHTLACCTKSNCKLQL